MLARFRVALPFPLSRQSDEVIPPIGIDVAGYELLVRPPYQAVLRLEEVNRSTKPINEFVEQLAPAEPIETNATETISGVPTFHANALEIEVRRDDFDRMPTGGESAGDPPIAMFFEVANSVLRRIRSVTQSGLIKTISEKTTIWRLQYLADDGTDLAPNPPFIRKRAGGHFSWSFVGLNAAIWNQALSLPESFQPYVWEILYQDAITLLPERGPALVLAASALETLIAQSLEVLAASTTMPPGLWKWINDRDDYRKEPSVEDRFDDLLRILVGKSLKSEKELWETFKNIKNARNSFVHGGKPLIGKQEVTVEQAYSLLGKAADILKWVEEILPVTHRRNVATNPPQVQFTRWLYAVPEIAPDA